MENGPNAFPDAAALAEYARNAHEYTGYVLSIEGEGEDRAFIGRYEDERDLQREVTWPTDTLRPDQEAMLTEGAPFKLTLTPENESCFDSIDGVPVAKHEMSIEFLPTEPITQAEIDAALAEVRAQRQAREN